MYMNKQQLIKQRIKQLIEGCTAGLSAQIEWFTQYNQPVKIIDDALSEVITAATNDTLCGGTGGGGWDHKDNAEVKGTSHVQSRFCANCGKKVSFFATECPHCGCESFKANAKQKGTKVTNPRDGRWGISAMSHFKYKPELKEYRLTIVEPLTDDPSCREFRYTYFVVDKDSVHLNNYAKAQLESPKSDNINFQPYGVDFYLSLPVMKFTGVLTVYKDYTKFEFEFFDLNNTTPLDIPDRFVNITSKEVIAKKKRRLGKKRGEWRRN